jgi:AcrR family transcriptional regulator
VKKKRAYHHGDLRLTLLRVVGDLVREEGVGALSLRAVARRADVSHNAPAHHFGTKEGLLTAFAAEGFNRLAATMAEAQRAEGATTGPHLLAASGRGYVRFALDHPDEFAMMFRPELVTASDPVLAAASKAAYEPLRIAIDRCVAEGLLDGVDPHVAAVAAWSLPHGFADLWFSGRLQGRRLAKKRDVIEMASAITSLFVSSLTGQTGQNVEPTRRSAPRLRRSTR